ncbi:hypothetical protein SAMN05444162_2422 [Paenibacillaceae bacterium GAS479]|nr:hypothetical protein SAMN05444162_2422 [Paenibacillaceae bacterium GAS479]
MRKSLVLTTSLALLLSAAAPSYSSAQSTTSLEVGIKSELEDIRLEAINDTLNLNGRPKVSDIRELEKSKRSSFAINSNEVALNNEIDTLKNIEVVKIVVDSEGEITSALSSTEGAIEERFQFVTQDTYEPTVEQQGSPTQFSKTISLFSSSQKKLAVKRTPSAFALLPNSNNPNGYKTGAFNRITTPANTSAYTNFLNQYDPA